MEAIKHWFFKKCCKYGFHIYEDMETRDEKTRHGTLFGIPIESSVFFRTCANCTKEQRMDWFVWRDIPPIAPARMISDE